MTQYSIRLKQSAIRARDVYFLHSTMIPRVTFLRLSDVSVICCVTYVQFPTHSAFLSYIGRHAAPALRHTIGFNTQYRISDVTENLSRYTFPVQCTDHRAQKKDYELILTVKMETSHLIEGQFGCEFSATCNHCGVMTA